MEKMVSFVISLHFDKVNLRTFCAIFDFYIIITMFSPDLSINLIL